MRKKSPLNLGIPKFLSLEHAVLEVIDAAARSNCKAVSSTTVIKMINEKKFLEILEKTSVTSGAIFGTLSRLKGKHYLSKVMILENGREVLAYKITDSGQTVLNEIRKRTANAVDQLTDYQPVLN